MKQFELLERDGLARIGRFPTPHGEIRTPALLPVVHPDPARQTISPSEMRSKFGLGAVITSSYIAWRTAGLRERAERDGIHAVLGFDGPVMTDSGAFQQHAYGSVEVGAEEILAFQGRIGSDIATVLDIFVEPDAGPEAARDGVEATAERSKRARELREGLLAVPVQGGAYPDLRLRSAESASELGDLLAVGGVVPLMERYRFAELARAVTAARPGLAPEHPVHLFGTGHPMLFAFAALLGVDLFDSSSYHKFARRGALLFPEGTVALANVREPFCGCWVCSEVPLDRVAKLALPDRERHLARHNLLQCALEVARVRQAIRDGTLWELAERRAPAHPALVAGLREMLRGARVMAPAEPVSRGTFRATSPLSALRPSVIKFLVRLRQYRSGKGEHRVHRRVALTPGSLRHIPPTGPDGVPILYECPTPIGTVPLELTEVYPVGCWIGPEEFEPPPPPGVAIEEESDPPAPLGESLESDRVATWTTRQVAAVLEWQFGPDATELASGLIGERSRRSGRLSAASGPGGRWFVFGPGAVPRPTWLGAQALHRTVAYPRARIVVDPDAIPFVTQGRSLFSTFVRGGDSSLAPEGPALLVDPDDHLLAVGRLLLAPFEMGRMRRGVAVRVTAHARAAGDRPVEEPDDEPPVGYG